MSAAKACPRRAARSYLVAARRRAHQRYLARLAQDMAAEGYDLYQIVGAVREADFLHRVVKGAP